MKCGKLFKNDFTRQMFEFGFVAPEIPPCFSSRSFAKCHEDILKFPGLDKSKQTFPTQLSIYKDGVTRRIISVPNPYSFANTVKYMKDHWRQIEKHSQSENSQSPITRVYFKYGDEKAEILNGESAQDAVRLRSSYLGNVRERVICALGFGYKLSVDISMCYSSIYTHSLSWSVCGRDEAKRNYFLEKKADRSKEYLFADELDKRIRNQKGSETNGILTGPFSSRIFSELILAGVDREIRESTSIFGKPFSFKRYVDDYWFYFRSEPEARAAIPEIGKLLGRYNLSLNTSKTKIEEYPFDSISPMKESLKAALRREGVFGLLNEAGIWHLAGEKGAYKYALKMLSGNEVKPEDIDVVLSALFNINLLNPKYCSYIVGYIKNNENILGPNRLARIVNEELEEVIGNHLEQEVANLLFFVKELDLAIKGENIIGVLRSESDFSKIIALDLWKNHNDRVKRAPREAQQINDAVNELRENMVNQTYDGEHWLLLHEIAMHDLVNGSTRVKSGKTDPFFDWLKMKGVSFYC